MKAKFIFIVLTLIFLITLINNITKNDEETLFKPLELDVGDEFTNLNYEKTMYVLNYGIGEVTGDNENDMVIIIGEKEEPKELNAQNIDVVVYDTLNKSFIKGTLRKCSGMSPKVIINDIDGNNISDIILVTENEDMTKNIRVLTVKEGESKEIFKAKDNKGLLISGAFLDGFKATLSSKKINFERNIELNDKKENYITSGFYDDEGRVIASKKDIVTSNFTSVELVLLNGQYGIKTTQRIKGFDNLDIIDEIEVIWKYENGTWSIKEAMGEKLGNLLY